MGRGGAPEPRPLPRGAGARDDRLPDPSRGEPDDPLADRLDGSAPRGGLPRGGRRHALAYAAALLPRRRGAGGAGAPGRAAPLAAARLAGVGHAPERPCVVLVAELSRPAAHRHGQPQESPLPSLERPRGDPGPRVHGTGDRRGGRVRSSPRGSRGGRGRSRCLT